MVSQLRSNDSYMKEASSKIESAGKEFVRANPGCTEKEEAEYITTLAEKEINMRFPPLFGEPEEVVRSGRKNRAAVLLNSGKIMSSSEYENTLAYKFIAKSVRLDPKVPESWFLLGQCVFKRNDNKYAIGCFKRALAIERSAPVLTALAGVYRTQANSTIYSQEQAYLRRLAIELLEEAVVLDPKLGTAQMALGTGYFLNFFSTLQVHQELLTKSIGCYEKALNCTDTAGNADMHFNYSTLLKFCDNAEKALKHFIMAKQLDPRDINRASEKIVQHVSFLKYFSEDVLGKGGMKPKEVSALINSMKDEKCPPNCVIGRVAFVGTEVDAVPITLTICTKDGEFVGVTIYNFASYKGFEKGDLILIKNPVRKSIKDIKMDGDPPITIFAFSWYRVESPLLLQKNKESFPNESLSHARLEVEQQATPSVTKKFVL